MITILVLSGVVAAESPRRTPISTENLTDKEKKDLCEQIECELHKCRFELIEAPISYGSRKAHINDELTSAYRRISAGVAGQCFPNAPPRSIHVGFLAEEKRTDLSCACSVCLRAREEWDGCCSERFFRECSDQDLQKKLAEYEQQANVHEEFGDEEEAARLREAIGDFRSQCEDLWRQLEGFDGVEGCDENLTPRSSGPESAAASDPVR